MDASSKTPKPCYISVSNFNIVESEAPSEKKELPKSNVSQPFDKAFLQSMKLKAESQKRRGSCVLQPQILSSISSNIRKQHEEKSADFMVEKQNLQRILTSKFRMSLKEVTLPDFAIIKRNATNQTFN